MSAPAQQAAENAVSVPQGGRPRPRRRRRIITTAVVIVIIAGGGAGGYYGFRHLHRKPPAAAANSDPTGLAAVTRQTLSSQTSQNGTLGYSGSYTVIAPSGSSGSSGASGSSGGQGSSGSPAGGTFTSLPAAGQVISQGQPVYSVANSPVVLLYGSEPVYRSLSQGDSGNDVKQLNSDLVALGDATRSELDPSSDYFGGATATALDKLQSSLGLTQTGTLPLGQAVFEPTSIRVGKVTATLGAPVHAGSPVMTATSDTPQVVAQVDPTNLSDVKAGADVTVTLPDNQTTPGVVTSIGNTATSTSSGGTSDSGSSSSATSTVNVYIRLTRPSAAGAIDQAPVSVSITSQTVDNALAVPIQALIAEPGGYAVEVAGPHGTRRAVPVTLGLFDDAAGLVQVTGALSPGEQVVVPRI